MELLRKEWEVAGHYVYYSEDNFVGVASPESDFWDVFYLRRSRMWAEIGGITPAYLWAYKALHESEDEINRIFAEKMLESWHAQKKNVAADGVIPDDKIGGLPDDSRGARQRVDSAISRASNEADSIIKRYHRK
jgi:hypothetical protein